MTSVGRLIGALLTFPRWTVARLSPRAQRDDLGGPASASVLSASGRQRCRCTTELIPPECPPRPPLYRPVDAPDINVARRHGLNVSDSALERLRGEAVRRAPRNRMTRAEFVRRLIAADRLERIDAMIGERRAA